ncbi:MAG: hypothetical protein MHM6MM_009411, partial [Cercozoa sp. M6MM]
CVLQLQLQSSPSARRRVRADELFADSVDTEESAKEHQAQKLRSHFGISPSEIEHFRKFKKLMRIFGADEFVHVMQQQHEQQQRGTTFEQQVLAPVPPLPRENSLDTEDDESESTANTTETNSSRSARRQDCQLPLSKVIPVRVRSSYFQADASPRTQRSTQKLQRAFGLSKEEFTRFQTYHDTANKVMSLLGDMPLQQDYEKMLEQHTPEHTPEQNEERDDNSNNDSGNSSGSSSHHTPKREMPSERYTKKERLLGMTEKEIEFFTRCAKLAAVLGFPEFEDGVPATARV